MIRAVRKTRKIRAMRSTEAERLKEPPVKEPPSMSNAVIGMSQVSKSIMVTSKQS